MPLVINSNIQSLNSQRQLVNSGNELSQAMERLSSGKRINTAGDDAAGLAISNRMTSQVKGLDRAVANANDGVSMIQTAEGALDETTNILQRMRELSIQSSNGIYSDADRSTINAEVQQLKSEIDRISETTSFNGQNVLDGSVGEVKLQVGANSNQTIDFELGKMDTKSLGSGNGGDVVGAEMAAATLGAVADGDLKINGQSVGALTATQTLGEQLDQINTNVSNVEAKAFVEATASAQGTGVIQGSDKLEIEVTKQDGTETTYQVSDTSNMQELAAKITETSGGELVASVNDEGKLQVTSDSAASITFSVPTAAATPTAAENTMATNIEAATGLDVLSSGGTPAAQDKAFYAQLSLTSKDGSDVTMTVADGQAAAVGLNTRTGAGDVRGSVDFTATTTKFTEGQLKINGVEIGGNTDTAATATAATRLNGAVDAINKKSAETGVVAVADGVRLKLESVDGKEIKIEMSNGMTSASLGGIQETNSAASASSTVANIDISTQAGAQKAIDVIDGALEQINSTRADMGAVTNRLEHTVSNLMNISENTSASRSRIQDADFASETANLSRAQVLQQASSAMLAQANSAPQQVLSLLR